MKTPYLALLLAAAAYCQAPATTKPKPPAAAPAPKPLAKEDGLELENIALQSVVNQKTIEGLQAQFSQIQRDQQDLQKQYNSKIEAICSKEGLKVTDCDVQKAATGKEWTVAKKPSTAPVSGQITGAGQPVIAPPRGNQ